MTAERRCIGVGLTALFLVVLASAARATNYQVPADFPTLLAAADAAVPGDTLFVAPGTYPERETRQVGASLRRANAFVAAGVVIVGTGGAESTRLLADAPVMGVTNAIVVVLEGTNDPCALRGLTLDGGSSPSVVGVTKLSLVGSVTLVDCVVENCGAAVRHGGFGFLRARTSTFRGNESESGGYSGVVESDAELYLDRCRFEDNVGAVVFRGYASLQPWFDIHHCSFIGNAGRVLEFEDNLSMDGRLYSNLFFGNVVPQDAVMIRLWSLEEVEFRSNVFSENSGGDLLDVWPTMDRYCNLYWSNESEPGTEPSGSDLQLDPEFCDPLSGDFRVASSSPCLPENQFLPCFQRIGPFGSGCPSTGSSVHQIATGPADFPVIIDGVEVSSPAVVAWQQGAPHTIGTVEAASAGSERRFSFESWSDGGARIHEVIGPARSTRFLASFQEEFFVTMVVEGDGAVQPESGWHRAQVPFEIEALPGYGQRFVRWDGAGSGYYRGEENPAIVVPRGPFTQVAYFDVGEFLLETEAVGGGRVVPSGGPFPAFAPLVLRGRADRGEYFVEWLGFGEGSYTGRANPVTITMDGPMKQVAIFKPVRFDVKLSLSGTSPHVQVGSPLGVGEVHVWVTCTGGRRVQEVRLRVAGSLQPLAFIPAPGVVASGVEDVRATLGTCSFANVRLGSFLVVDPSGGTLCVDASAPDGPPLVVVDCSGGLVPWPERVSFTGVNTAGGAPCSTGTGCINQIEMGPEAGDGTDVALAAPMRIGLNEVFPNPFTGETTIRYAVSRPQSVTLTVYDVTGRRVRALRHGPAAPGPASVVWDGRDADGSRVASGVYFVRMQADDVTEARKVIRLAPR